MKALEVDHLHTKDPLPRKILHYTVITIQNNILEKCQSCVRLLLTQRPTSILHDIIIIIKTLIMKQCHLCVRLTQYQFFIIYVHFVMWLCHSEWNNKQIMHENQI